MSDFSVVIATRNRKDLLSRAIRSALEQRGETPEVIVVDDASTDGTADYVTRTFPAVRLERMSRHGGPGPARNSGMALAGGRWVVVLDDDDELRPDALRVITERLDEIADRDRYPTFLFRHGNGRFDTPFQLLTIEHFWDGTLQGDFLTVWNRSVALAQDCRYPDSRIGAEGLMWLELAQRFRIPTWGDCVGVVHADASDRLTGIDAQLQNAAEHARIQDRYAEILKRGGPTRPTRRVIARRIAAAAFYYLLAGERGLAVARATALLRRHPVLGVPLLVCAMVPRAWLASVLRVYRRARTPRTAQV